MAQECATVCRFARTGRKRIDWRPGAARSLLSMKRLLIALLLTVVATSTHAHEYKLGALEIKHPWTRATPKNAPVAGGYLKITNTGATPDRLTGGSAEVAQKFEVHEMSMDGGVMRMRELKEGLEIPPGATVELKPGSYHIMMMNLSRPLAKGDKVKGSLTFEKAGKIDVEFTVEAMGGSPAAAKMDQMH
jgi:copper(I)-binding protein